MSRLEFMKELAGLLEDLPREEKIEILKYYNGYFDDAGEENEAAIIEELGSPAKVAASVKAGMDDHLAEHMEFTEKGADDEKIIHEYEERRSQEQSGAEDGGYSDEDVRERRYEERRPGGGGGSGSRGLLIVILILTCPIWGGLVLGLFGGFMGLFGGLIGVCAAAVGCLIAFFCSGVTGIIRGFAKLFISPLGGMMSISVGILSVGIGLFCLLLCGWIFSKLIPAVFRGIRSVFRAVGRLLHGRRAA